MVEANPTLIGRVHLQSDAVLVAIDKQQLELLHASEVPFVVSSFGYQNDLFLK